MLLDPTMAAFEAIAPLPTKTHPATRPPADTAFPTVYPDPPVFQHVGKAGEVTLWVVFVLFVLATIGFAVVSWRVPATKRLHHSLVTLITIIGAISYFAMATGGGVFTHHRRIPEHHIKPLPPTHTHVYRDVFYARYIDWLLTTPLILLNLALLSGLSGASIFSSITANVIMILTGWFAAVSHTKVAKWGWYAMSLLAFIWVIYTLLVTGTATARAKNVQSVSRFYTLLTGYTIIVWIAYPIIWAIAGRRIVSVNGEVIAYAVIDLFAKIGFGAWLIAGHHRLPEGSTEVNGFWASGFNREGRIRIDDSEDA